MMTAARLLLLPLLATTSTAQQWWQRYNFTAEAERLALSQPACAPNEQPEPSETILVNHADPDGGVRRALEDGEDLIILSRGRRACSQAAGVWRTHFEASVVSGAGLFRGALPVTEVSPGLHRADTRFLSTLLAAGVAGQGQGRAPGATVEVELAIRLRLIWPSAVRFDAVNETSRSELAGRVAGPHAHIRDSPLRLRIGIAAAAGRTSLARPKANLNFSALPECNGSAAAAAAHGLYVSPRAAVALGGAVGLDGESATLPSHLTHSLDAGRRPVNATVLLNPRCRIRYRGAAAARDCLQGERLLFVGASQMRCLFHDVRSLLWPPLGDELCSRGGDAGRDGDKRGASVAHFEAGDLGDLVAQHDSILRHRPSILVLHSYDHDFVASSSPHRTGSDLADPRLYDAAGASPRERWRLRPIAQYSERLDELSGVIRRLRGALPSLRVLWASSVENLHPPNVAAIASAGNKDLAERGKITVHYNNLPTPRHYVNDLAFELLRAAAGVEPFRLEPPSMSADSGLATNNVHHCGCLGYGAGAVGGTVAQLLLDQLCTDRPTG